MSIFTRKKSQVFHVDLNEPPKPVTEDVIHSLTVINNHTDKEYVYTDATTEDFGLTVEYTAGKMFIIRQYDNREKNNWRVIARLTNFSITKFEWKTITYVPEIPKKK